MADVVVSGPDALRDIPNPRPYRNAGELTNSAAWKTAHSGKAPARTTLAGPATTIATQSPATTVRAKPYDINCGRCSTTASAR